MRKEEIEKKIEEEKMTIGQCEDAINDLEYDKGSAEDRWIELDQELEDFEAPQTKLDALQKDGE